MAASALIAPGGPNGSNGPGRRRKQSPITFGRILVVVGIGLAIVIGWNLTNRSTVTERPNEVTTTTVILPPPPPPPPPQPEQVEQPPEPTVAPPIDQPVDTPPPEAPSQDSAPGDSALTAREGAGPSNYGLVGGDGSGTRIGGRPGGSGDGFRAYGELTQREVTALTQRGGRDITRGSYSIQLAVRVDPTGRITDIQVLRGSGDSRRDAAIRTLLIGQQLSQRPPAGLPTVRIELNARSGG